MNMPFQKITAETDFVSAATPPKQTFEQAMDNIASGHRSRIQKLEDQKRGQLEQIEEIKRQIALADAHIAASKAYLVELEKAR